MLLQSIRLAALVIAALGPVATGIASEPTATPPAAASQPAVQAQSLPEPTGTYAVGRMAVRLVAASRADEQGSRADPKLQPVVQVWYPARAGVEGKPASWLPADRAGLEEKGFVGMLLRKPAGPSARDIPKVLASVVVHAREDVPLADSPKQFPVLVFSAGSQTIPSTYSCLVEDLASRGFVVVGYGPTVMGLGIWKDDLTHLLDQLKVWNSTREHTFFGRLDLDKVGAFGHSFGASAVSTIAGSDKRVKAIVLLDGGGRPEDGRAIPALILNSEGVDLARRFPDVAKDGARKQSEFLRRAKPGIKITLLGAVHMSFTDMAVIKAFGLPGDGKAYIDATRAVIGEFFGRYLEGKDSELIEKGSAKYPLVKIETPR